MGRVTKKRGVRQAGNRWRAVLLMPPQSWDTLPGMLSVLLATLSTNLKLEFKIKTIFN